MEKRFDVNLSFIGGRLLMSSIFHPVEYAKFLIQIGHEPIKPFPTKTLFGKPVYGLPNVFRYVSYIYDVDGFNGCYRGLLATITCSSVYIAVHSAVAKNTNLKESDNEDQLSENEKRILFVNELTNNVMCKTAAIVVTQPLHVVACRIMAQFVGGETKYSFLLSSLWTIYKEEGFSGLFAGLIPRWFAEISTLILASTITFAFNEYLVQDKELKTYTGTMIQFVTSSLMYPFHVVGACMTVTGSGLASGSPPQMPLYLSSFDCWKNLARQNQLKRGSSLFFRYYTRANNNILHKVS
uniref:Mitochondrial carrier homolog 2 n=1 Tax=Clastoptera arizonana TaxID=38151 RepID=A0A1B6D1T8_9HEMI